MTTMLRPSPLRPSTTVFDVHEAADAADAADAPVRRPRSKRGEGDRLRDEILDAVDAILMANPTPDAVSIRAVAERVGCTPPAIYLHFFDKQELLFDVCARRFRQLSQAIDVAVAAVPEADQLGRLEAGMRAYVRFGLDHPEHYRILFMGRSILTPDQLDELRRHGVNGVDPLVERCRRCIKAGVVTGDDPKLMAYGAWSVVHGLVSLQIAKPHVDWPANHKLTDHLIGTHLRGLTR
jgi:AcrR family transcriptional regulator